MAKANRENLPRVNFFDGQRVTEADLDAEQTHHRDLVANLTRDFHGSGVVRDRLFEGRVLLDTSSPSENVSNSDQENASEFIINSGSYDGTAITLDRQPSDVVYGNRIEIQAEGLTVGGRISAKVLVIGTTYSSLSSAGELVSEVLEFGKNETKVTEHYYTRVVSVLFNNFSGGSGRTEYSLTAESWNTALAAGRFVFRESEPLKVFSRTKTSFQTDSPNVALASFVTSGTELSIEDEIKAGLGAAYNYNDLYVELQPEEEIYFRPDGDSTIQYGQKFLAKSNNIQKIDLLMSTLRDDTAAAGSEHDFSGDIVISIHRLSTDINCITDPNPDNLIDFDPEQSPLIEMSYSQEDLAILGYKLSADPQVVSFDFSGTLIADPTIEPSIDVDEFYAILISRRGDNRTGTLAMQKGYDRPSRKVDNGQSLNALERFGKQTSRFIEFDPNNLAYVDDSDSSLWFVVHSDTVEVTDGIAYTDDGISVILAKTEEYVGSTEVSKFLRNIPLGNVAEGTSNLLVLQRQDDFISPSTHPRTGNFVNTRILDAPVVSVMSEAQWAAVDVDYPPILLARVKDLNVRDAQDILGTFGSPGYTDSDEIIFINPSTDLLTSNLINRIITPDLDCSCASRYRIISADCEIAYAGDIDGDGKLTTNDIAELLNVVGNTVNSGTTERKVLGGELDPIAFFKSDLNNDGSVDGTDIELLEDAVDGYSNFSVPESFNILRLKLENVLEEDDYPEILSTGLFSESIDPNTSTGSSSDMISLTTETEAQALSIRAGDNVSVSSESSDSGTYIIYSKVVDETGFGVTLSVTESDGSEVVFVGSNGFSISIISGTRVNTFADNQKLLDVPYTKKAWSIAYVGAPHSEDFIDVCDLRRYAETNFIEEFEESCVFSEESCAEEEVCTPQYKNQKVLADDLFIPNGEIYKAPGVPYHGDIEYATITLPLPPGSIDDCSVDLYTSFIKSAGGSRDTAAGYPAMMFSDGTYVGCEDAGADTDIAKGRVKISQCISSLYVDAFVDGYAVDGYADESSMAYSTEVISEGFTDYTYPSSSGFADWGTSFSGSIEVSDGLTPGWNVPVDFVMSTINASEERVGTLSYPGAISEVTGDFIIDFTMSRVSWPESDLTFGEVRYFATLHIDNVSTETTLKLGWRHSAYGAVELFYSGTIEDSTTGALVSDFDYSVVSKDSVGEEVRFRLRRINDAVFAMYYNDYSVESSDNITGQPIRLGELPDVQPGAGDATLSFGIAQYSSPNVGVAYATKLHDVAIKSDYIASSDSEEASILISRDAASLMNRATVTFPIVLTQRTNVVSATMTITSVGGISSTDSFNIIPYDILNADNLGTVIDYPLEDNDSFVVSFTPGNILDGESVEVDVTSLALYFLSQPGHLPGFHKALIIEPSTSAESSIAISPDVEFVIEYEEVTTGVIFKVGVSIDASTGIASLQTKNILYDSLNDANRTVLKFGVHLKKSGFKNDDLTVGIKDLNRIGIGTCIDEAEFVEGELCYFVAGSTATGLFVEGPFPCAFHIP